MTNLPDGCSLSDVPGFSDLGDLDLEGLEVTCPECRDEAPVIAAEESCFHGYGRGTTWKVRAKCETCGDFETSYYDGPY